MPVGPDRQDVVARLHERHPAEPAPGLGPQRSLDVQRPEPLRHRRGIVFDAVDSRAREEVLEPEEDAHRRIHAREVRVGDRHRRSADVALAAPAVQRGHRKAHRARSEVGLSSAQRLDPEAVELRDGHPAPACGRDGLDLSVLVGELALAAPHSLPRLRQWCRALCPLAKGIRREVPHPRSGPGVGARVSCGSSAVG